MQRFYLAKGNKHKKQLEETIGIDYFFEGVYICVCVCVIDKLN